MTSLCETKIHIVYYSYRKKEKNGENLNCKWLYLMVYKMHGLLKMTPLLCTLHFSREYSEANLNS